MTVFSTNNVDATQQPCFFGEPVNIARYDKQTTNVITLEFVTNAGKW